MKPLKITFLSLFLGSLVACSLAQSPVASKPQTVIIVPSKASQTQCLPPVTTPMNTIGDLAYDREAWVKAFCACSAHNDNRIEADRGERPAALSVCQKLK